MLRLVFLVNESFCKFLHFLETFYREKYTYIVEGGEDHWSR